MKKKIFKKNRLVIFALSVMIGVAGYLNFNAGKRDDLLRQKAKETNADAEVISYDSEKADASDTSEKELTDQANKETMGVVITTGGISYPLTGSTGDGYRFAESAGHTIKELLPSLVPFELKNEFCKELMGLSLKNVELVIKCGKKCLFEEQGELLFTHFGISGPLVIKASAYLHKYLDKDLSMYIDLKPAMTEEMLDDRILRDFSKYTNKDFHNSLGDLLPVKLIDVVIKRSEIDPYKKVNSITKEERKNLVTVLKHFTLSFQGLRGFDEAIITKGGVNVKEVDPSTMQSKLADHLYFAGEVLDVDALTGGFNLQIAWSTGYLAGLACSEES